MRLIPICCVADGSIRTENPHRKIEHHLRPTHPTEPQNLSPTAVSIARFAPHPSPAFAARSTPARVAQNVAVVAAVLVLHGAALWALQNGLVERATPPALALPRVITAQLIAAAAPSPAPAATPAETPRPAAPQRAEPPAPPIAPTPVPRKVAPEPPRARAKAPQRKPVIRRPAPPRPAPVTPEPVASAPVNPAPAPANTTPAPAPAASAAPAPAAATAAAATAPAPTAAPRTVLPSSSAAYLNNTPPPYPPLARRLGESGTVVVRVLIGTNGRAEKAQIEKSSGYERLDQAALETARDRWRYVPGTRNGVPEAMWFKVPIKFVLE